MRCVRAWPPLCVEAAARSRTEQSSKPCCLRGDRALSAADVRVAFTALAACISIQSAWLTEFARRRYADVRALAAAETPMTYASRPSSNCSSRAPITHDAHKVPEALAS